MKANRQCVVEIKKYSKKGVGQGSAVELQKTIEVRGAHPGEQLLVEILKRKKGNYQANVLEILKEHPCRISPRCQHAGVCGGCSYQSLSYEKQSYYKEEKLRDLFKDVIGEGEFFPMIAMEDPWQFRNKMEFSFYEDREQNKCLGLVMAGTKGRVLNLEECHLVRPWMIKVLTRVRKWWEGTTVQAYHRLKNEGTLHTLTLREGMQTGEKLVMLTISGSPSGEFSHKELEAFKQAVLGELEGVVSLFLQIKHIQEGKPTQYNEMLLSGPDHIHEKLCITYPDGTQKTLVFKISPSSFFQPNTFQAEKLFSRALQMVTKKDRLIDILDLYCGTATLGIVFASLAKKVIGIELNPYAVYDAHVNTEANGISNVEVIQGDVKDILKTEAVNTLKDIDLMIVDPPRVGLGPKTLKEVLSFLPKEILYISCNPYTQIEDVKECLLNGYFIKAIQPVDQFPHSAHVENIVLLQRKN